MSIVLIQYRPHGYALRCRFQFFNLYCSLPIEHMRQITFLSTMQRVANKRRLLDVFLSCVHAVICVGAQRALVWKDVEGRAGDSALAAVGMSSSRSVSSPPPTHTVADGRKKRCASTPSFAPSSPV